ncbi:MAG: aminotransferase class I/II-fold pyridoxal phosphate-dependent enzyme [Desulfobacterales bacterium]
MITGHGGNIYKIAAQHGCNPSEIIDMSSNVNPLGPPSGFIAFLKKNINSITSLPEVDSAEAIIAFSKYYNISKSGVLAGNGTTQFIYSIPRALCSKKVLILGPTYSDYEDSCIMNNVKYEYIIAKESSSFLQDIDIIKKKVKHFDTIFICNPDNPTGVLMNRCDLESLISSYPDKNFIIDESYMPFSKKRDSESVLYLNAQNVIVLNSMSKIFRIPGLRTGFLIASKQNIKKFLPYTLPWSVNSIAQSAVCYLMNPKNGAEAFIEKTVDFIEKEKARFIKHFEDIAGIKLYPSTTSFILIKLGKNLSAKDICKQMSFDKILIRNCSNFKGLSDKFVRISMKTGDLNLLAAKKLSDIILNQGNK